MTSETELVEGYEIGRLFPDLPDGNIIRENLLEMIENLYTNDKAIVVVQGEDGIGKTTLLRQFVSRHGKESFGLFIKGDSKFAYDPRILKYEMANQIHWFLRGKGLDFQKEFDGSCYNDLISGLKRFLDSQRNKYAYFVIDGLDDINERDKRIKEDILQLFPLGLKPIRFLISGNTIEAYLQKRKSEYKTCQIAPFGADEVVKYLKDFTLETSDVIRLRSNCKGHPGFLSNVRQLLKDGVELNEIIDKGHSKLTDIYEMQWKNISSKEWVIELLTRVSLEIEKYTILTIAESINVSVEDVSSLITSSNYLEEDKNEKFIHFVSNTFKEFVYVKLKKRINDLKKARIENLKMNEKDNLLTLLNYYDESSDKENVLGSLSNANVIVLLEKKISLAQIKRFSEMGMFCSKELNNTEDELRFALYGTMINERYNFESRKMEIVISVRLNELKRALQLAQNESKEELRLHLLAIYAREVRKKKIVLDKEVVDQIRLLFKQVDIKHLENKLIEVASDLMFSCPDLAIALIESKSKLLKGEDAFDNAVAHASTELLFEPGNKVENKTVFEEVKGKMKNEDIKELFQSIYSFVDNYGPDNVIEETRKLDKVSNKMLLLRSWAEVNEKNPNAYKVIEYALDVILKSVEYLPTADLIREIITPTPYVSDIEKKKRIIGIVDGQHNVLFQQGLSEEYFRIQLLLVHAEWTFDEKKASHRIEHIFFEIMQLSDLSMKAACYAWAIVYLEKIDPGKILEMNDKYHSLFTSELNKIADEILNNTADHYTELHHILKALSKTKLEVGFNLCMKMNLEFRRNNSISFLLREYYINHEKQLKNAEIDETFKMIKGITNCEVRDELIAFIMTTLVNKKMIIEDLSQFENTLNSIDDLSIKPKARVLSAQYIISVRAKTTNDKLLNIKKEILEVMNRIDDPLIRINEYYWLSKKVVNDEVELAKLCLEEIKKIRAVNVIDSFKSRRVYTFALKLLIRVFGELIRNRMFHDADKEMAEYYIGKLSSNSLKAMMWAYLASYYFEIGDDASGRDIAIKYVQKHYENISHDDKDEKANALIFIAPILYKAQKRITQIKLHELDKFNMNWAYKNIVNYYFCKFNLEIAYEVNVEKREKIKFEDLLEILEIAKDIKHDGTLFTIIKEICSLFHEKSNYPAFNKTEALRRLRELLKAFPDTCNIKHNGYLIASLGCIGRIEDLNGNEWDELLKKIDGVPNVSDRTLIYSIFIEVLPSKFNQKRSAVIDKAKDCLDKIPSDHDRLGRCESLIESCKQVDCVSAAKEILKTAMDIYSNNKEAGSEKGLKKLVGLAYKLDQKYASSLVTLFDSDPARIEEKKRVENEIEKCKCKEEMGNPLKDEICFDPEKYDKYPQMCYELLQSTKIKKTPFLSFKKTECLIEMSSKYPFYNCFPIIGLALETLVCKADGERVDLIRLKENIYSTLIFLLKLLSVNSIEEKKVYETYEDIKRESKTSVNIGAGERDEVVKWISEWICENISDSIVICDPYFGLEELWLLQSVLNTKPLSVVKILTSKEHQIRSKVKPPFDEEYRKHWRTLMECDPPATEIVIANYVDSGETTPFHDRYILSGESGLKLGTSINSIGMKKESGIELLNREEVGDARMRMLAYLERKTNQQNDLRILYNTFTM